MRVPFFQVDAFAERRFTGNPAAVMPMDRYPDDAVLQAIAAENNLAETAFIVRDGDEWLLRWFTPAVEIELCGHATLASGAVVMERLEPARTSVAFRTRHHGVLTVARGASGYEMDFPAMPPVAVEAPAALTDALGAAPHATLASPFDLVAVFDDASTVRSLAPDLAAVALLEYRGVIATAPGDDGDDFVSRFFAPRVGVPEDPVTGSAHCTLAPYWAARLDRTSLTGWQASPRGGRVGCRLVGDRVVLSGGWPSRAPACSARCR